MIEGDGEDKESELQSDRLSRVDHSEFDLDSTLESHPRSNDQVVR